MAPNNPLTMWGNDKTMNLNTLILTNIQSSPYFKVQLFELKTFHEVVDEIYYRVEHLEPWEKGSRKTAGQTGMCGGVRGVGAGGIVSSAYCLLFKLFTLKLTKKQVNNLITHCDSPYIRGLGFMFIRYTQPPGDLWDWYEPYLDDEEELDVKAGGGHMMTIGEMLRQWLVKLEWYSTLFPRIPVPIQKDIDVKFRSRPDAFNSGFQGYGTQPVEAAEPEHIPDEEVSFGEAERAAMSQRGRGQSRGDHRNGYNSRRSPPRRFSPASRRSPYSRSERPSDDFARELEYERERQRRERDKDRGDRSDKARSKEKERDRSREKDRGDRDRSREKDRGERDRSREKDRGERDRSRENERGEKDRSREKDRGEKDRSREKDRGERDQSREKEKGQKEHKRSKHSKHRSRSRERARSDKKNRSRSRSPHKEKRKSRSRSRERKEKGDHHRHKEHKSHKHKDKHREKVKKH